MASKYHIDLAHLALAVRARAGASRARSSRRPSSSASSIPRGTVPYRLDVSRTAAGHAFRLRFDGDPHRTLHALPGRCRREVEVDAREVDEPGGGDEELISPYVDGDVLDVGSWAHDALILAAPPQILCRPDCAGLCPVCGESLNDADPAEHATRSRGPVRRPRGPAQPVADPRRYHARSPWRSRRREPRAPGATSAGRRIRQA